MLVLSSPSVENRNITSYLGIVTGSTVRARHVGSDILASLKNLVGGELQSYSKLLSSARDEAMERMVEEAKSKGADAVINFRFQTSTIAPGASEVIAYGTAVKLED
tara:strand:- start:863 stop:1180 length:318 start_codon:yes stop_codon:yes gene_type:complete